MRECYLKRDVTRSESIALGIRHFRCLLDGAIATGTHDERCVGAETLVEDQVCRKPATVQAHTDREGAGEMLQVALKDRMI